MTRIRSTCSAALLAATLVAGGSVGLGCAAYSRGRREHHADLRIEQ